jgi:uncharacterized protein (DUF1697 family)
VTGPRCIVLLRGVNVGAHNRIAMPAFRAVLQDLGCSDVRTHLQSGNAVVGWSGTTEALVVAVEDRLREALCLEVAVLVRTAGELERTVSGNPFAGEQLDPTLLHAVFLSGVAPELDIESMQPDRVVPGDRVVYVAYAVDAHSSKAAKLLSSKRFPVVASARNWRTVLALRELASG